MRRPLSGRARLVLLILAVIVAVGGLFVYNRFFREEPAPYFASDEEHFLYGSVGRSIRLLHSSHDPR